MPDFPAGMVLGDSHMFVVSTVSGCSLAPLFQGNTGAVAWPLANRAIFVPFRLPVTATVYRMACGTGTGTTGNFDLGIYDAGGNRLVSAGTTGKTTADSERVVDVTDTVLHPGMYYLAMATDGVTIYSAIAPTQVAYCKFMGMREMAAAFVLPATVTYATVSSAYVPLVGAYLRAD